MLVINSIEKSRLSADTFSYSGSGVAWKARFVLFLGFALLAGGLAGSVVSPPPLFASALLLGDGNRALFSKTNSASFCIDGSRSQIRHEELPAADVIFRHCECHCKWPCHAQVLSRHLLYLVTR